MDAIVGTTGDDTINAVAANPTTGAAITTLNAGDVIDGGAGKDTLNITMTAANNNSLTGVTVKNVEVINLTGGNFQSSGATATAQAAATAAKTATAADLLAKQAALVTAALQKNAADAVKVLAGTSGAGAPETAVVAAATVTVATAANKEAAATAVKVALTGLDNTAAIAAVAAINALTVVPTGVTAFSLADYKAAASAALKDAAGVALVTGTGTIIAARSVVLETAATAVNVAVKSTQQDLATAIQLEAAATAVKVALTGLDNTAAIAAVAAINALTVVPTGVTAFSLADYKAAASAALKDAAGVALVTGTGTTIAARSVVLETAATDLVAYETARGDFTLAQLNAAATAALSSATGATLVTNLDDSAAILARATVLDTAAGAVVTAAGTAVTAAIAADNTAATTLAAATAAAAAAGTASVSGATFAGSEQIWLVGADSNKTNVTVTTQAAGLKGVTGLDNTINFGAATAGVLAVEGSTGKSTLTGAAGGLTVAGTTGTLALTNTSATAAAGIKSMTVDMSGASSFDVSGMNQLLAVNSVGAGGVTINPKATTKLNSITTGDGNDVVRINTATDKDNLATPADETVNAVVSTGAGNDIIHLNTSGAGNTTVDAGAGNDTIYVSGVSTGAASIDAGAGNDTVHLTLAVLGTRPSLTIDGGSGTDTLVTDGGTLNAVDYLRMNTALSNFEAVRFASATTVDVSKLDIGSVTGLTFNDGANTVTEVAGQKLTLAAQAAVTGSDFVPAIATATSATALTATAAGYKVGASAVETVYGGALDVAASGNAAIALTLKGSSATLGVTATGGTTTVAPTVTLGAVASDLQSLTVNLASSNNTSTGLVVLASVDTGIITDTSATTYDEHLQSLSSLTVTGSGKATINNSGSNAADLVSLTTIDVSGMTAIFAIGLTGPTGANQSTTTITLNANAAETVILGGARDKVDVTTSTVKAMDTIIGFQLSANVDTPTLIDALRSDILVTGVAGASFVKFETTATTLIGALTEAGAYNCHCR